MYKGMANTAIMPSITIDLKKLIKAKLILNANKIIDTKITAVTIAIPIDNNSFIFCLS
jgi:hypothetical protein